MNTDTEFNELCQHEIVKIRELTLKDDEYTGDLLGDAVGSPTGITLCVEARMKQIHDLQADNERLRTRIAALEAERTSAGLLVTALSSGMYIDLNHIANNLDNISVVSWMEVHARTLGFTIGLLRRVSLALAAYAAARAGGDNGEARK